MFLNFWGTSFVIGSMIGVRVAQEWPHMFKNHRSCTV